MTWDATSERKSSENLRVLVAVLARNPAAARCDRGSTSAMSTTSVMCWYGRCSGHIVTSAAHRRLSAPNAALGHRSPRATVRTQPAVNFAWFT